jgi:hypothetical protein
MANPGREMKGAMKFSFCAWFDGRDSKEVLVSMKLELHFLEFYKLKLGSTKMDPKIRCKGGCLHKDSSNQNVCTRNCGGSGSNPAKFGVLST